MIKRELVPIAPLIKAEFVLSFLKMGGLRAVRIMIRSLLITIRILGIGIIPIRYLLFLEIVLN